jgi:hypothetical protein
MAWHRIVDCFRFLLFLFYRLRWFWAFERSICFLSLLKREEGGRHRVAFEDHLKHSGAPHLAS